jgi:hypothetical protein
VRVSIGDVISRTLLPSAPHFDSYDLAFTKSGAAPVEQVDLENLTAEVELAPGEWTLVLSAYLGSGESKTKAAEGTKTVSVVSGTLIEVTVEIAFEALEGTGTLSWVIGNTSGIEPVSAIIILDPEAEGENITIDLLSDPGYTGTRLNLAAGAYTLTVRLEGSERQASRTEAVHIVKDQVTEVSWDFAESNFSVIPPNVTEVTIGGENAVSLNQGATHQFSATVQGDHLTNTSVTWALSGAEKAGTTINAGTGGLTIAEDESVDNELTVTATAAADPTKSASVTVTVINANTPSVTIAVDPPAVEVVKGGNRLFEAVVTTGGGASDGVAWSLAGKTSDFTTLVPQDNPKTALLTVGEDESAETLTVTATSTAEGFTDRTSSATVTVTVTEVVVPPGTARISLAVKDEGKSLAISGVPTGGITIAKSASGSVEASATLTVSAGEYECSWYVDGAQAATGNSITLNAASYTVGGHSVTLMAKKGGVLWSGEPIPFTVVDEVVAVTGVTVSGEGEVTLTETGMPAATITLNASVTPANAIQGVTWSVSTSSSAQTDASAYATISNGGVLTAIGAGTVYVYATTVGVNASSQTITSSPHTVVIKPYAAASAALWEWTAGDGWSSGTEINGKYVVGNSGTITVEGGTGYLSMGAARWSVGTNSTEGTTSSLFHGGGQFDFSSQKARVTVEYVDATVAEKKFMIYLNNNTTGGANSVHGSSSSSGCVLYSENVSNASGTITATIDPSKITSGKDALATSFLYFRCEGDIKVFKITHIKIEYID